MDDDKIYIHILVNKVFKEELKNEAKSKGLSLNAYIRLILLERNGG